MKNSSPKYQRTDLASELSVKEYVKSGVIQKESCQNGFKIIKTVIKTAAASKALGREIGTYCTVFTGELLRLSERRRDFLVSLLSNMITELSENLIDASEMPKNLSILAAGLGNRHFTADSIGPLVIEKIAVTRGLYFSDPEMFRRLDCANVSAVAPGVSAETGIEAADLIKGAVSASKPDILILFDALAARSSERLARTVQITDTGIYPGSGIGNKRTPITKDTVGVPVITVGVPMIVDSASLVFDALTEAGISEEDIDLSLHDVLSGQKSFFVTPKDCDTVVKDMSALLADAVNIFSGVPFYTP